MYQPDYRIVANTAVPDISIVQTFNEDAFKFLVDELEFCSLPNGDIAVNSNDLQALVCEIEGAHFYAELA